MKNILSNNIFCHSRGNGNLSKRVLIIFFTCFQIFGGFFGATYAVEYENFPSSECQSVDVVYLQPKDNGKGQPQMFEVTQDKNNDWKIVPGQKGIENYEEQGFTDQNIIKRFKFGNERTGNIEYKKYCVGFQEALPVGPQGEISKSIGGDSGVDLVKNYVSMMYKFGSMIIGLICVFVMVVSGIQMSTGGLDSSAFENAKNRILAAILSLLVLFSSAMILRTINPGFFT